MSGESFAPTSSGEEVRALAEALVKWTLTDGPFNLTYAEGQEGPIFPDEMEKAKIYVQDFINWTK